MNKNPPFLRILVVDDEDSVHLQMRRVMQRPPPANAELFCAKTMEEALEVIPEIKPSVILLDLNLTHGWSWERTLGMIEPMDRLAGCPVIAFTGLDPEIWPKAIAAGAYNFFLKEQGLDHAFRAQILTDIANAIFLHRRFNPSNDAAPATAQR